MIIKEAKFIKSSTTLSECPEKKLPEYIFLGRSNVGKSSLINMLVNQNKLSKISSKLLLTSKSNKLPLVLK